MTPRRTHRDWCFIEGGCSRAPDVWDCRTSARVDATTGSVRRRVALLLTEFGEGDSSGWQPSLSTDVAGRPGTRLRCEYAQPRGQLYLRRRRMGARVDGRVLYMSDGSSRIRVVDPRGFRELRTIQVREADSTVWMLNELEWVRENCGQRGPDRSHRPHRTCNRTRRVGSDLRELADFSGTRGRCQARRRREWHRFRFCRRSRLRHRKAVAAPVPGRRAHTIALRSRCLLCQKCELADARHFPVLYKSERRMMSRDSHPRTDRGGQGECSGARRRRERVARHPSPL